MEPQKDAEYAEGENSELLLLDRKIGDPPSLKLPCFAKAMQDKTEDKQKDRIGSGGGGVAWDVGCGAAASGLIGDGEECDYDW